MQKNLRTSKESKNKTFQYKPPYTAKYWYWWRLLLQTETTNIILYQFLPLYH